MSVVLEVSRKISLSDRNAQSILANALKMGFAVRAVSGHSRGDAGVAAWGVLSKARVTTAESLGVRSVRGRKKTRGIYKIDSEMGNKMVEMRRDGLTIRSIAKAFRLSTSGVGNYIKRREREAIAS